MNRDVVIILNSNQPFPELVPYEGCPIVATYVNKRTIEVVVELKGETLTFGFVTDKSNCTAFKELKVVSFDPKAYAERLLVDAIRFAEQVAPIYSYTDKMITSAELMGTDPTDESTEFFALKGE